MTSHDRAVEVLSQHVPMSFDKTIACNCGWRTDKTWDEADAAWATHVADMLAAAGLLGGGAQESKA